MEFKSWTNKGKQTDFSHFLDYEEFMLLNLIGHTYHSAFGYNLDEVYSDMICVTKHDIIKGIYEDECILLDIELAEDSSKKTYLRHKTIIVRLDHKNNGTSWKSKPPKVNKTWFREEKCDKEEYWYNLPEAEFISARDGKKLRFVGPLFDRKYIHVVDEFEEIRLSSEDKGLRLTIDDVLFACRGLCADDTRSIQGFNIMSDNGSVLELKVNIDNWST